MTLDLRKSPLLRALTLEERRSFYLTQTESDEPQPKPEHSLVVVAELDDQVVVTISAERVWCVSNLWASRSLRGTGLAEQVARKIAAMNSEGLTEMLCTTSPHVELLAHRMGFTPIKGTTFRH